MAHADRRRRPASLLQLALGVARGDGGHGLHRVRPQRPDGQRGDHRRVHPAGERHDRARAPVGADGRFQALDRPRVAPPSSTGLPPRVEPKGVRGGGRLLVDEPDRPALALGQRRDVVVLGGRGEQPRPPAGRASRARSRHRRPPCTTRRSSSKRRTCVRRTPNVEVARKNVSTRRSAEAGSPRAQSSTAGRPFFIWIGAVQASRAPAANRVATASATNSGARSSRFASSRTRSRSTGAPDGRAPGVGGGLAEDDPDQVRVALGIPGPGPVARRLDPHVGEPLDRLAQGGEDRRGRRGHRLALPRAPHAEAPEQLEGRRGGQRRRPVRVPARLHPAAHGDRAHQHPRGHPGRRGPPRPPPRRAACRRRPARAGRPPPGQGRGPGPRPRPSAR